MGRVNHVNPEGRKARQISVLWWRSGPQAMASQSQEGVTWQEGLHFEEGPE